MNSPKQTITQWLKIIPNLVTLHSRLFVVIQFVGLPGFLAGCKSNDSGLKGFDPQVVLSRADISQGHGRVVAHHQLDVQQALLATLMALLRKIFEWDLPKST
jgi:hypothetical protein